MRCAPSPPPPGARAGGGVLKTQPWDARVGEELAANLAVAAARAAVAAAAGGAAVSPPPAVALPTGFYRGGGTAHTLMDDCGPPLAAAPLPA